MHIYVHNEIVTRFWYMYIPNAIRPHGTRIRALVPSIIRIIRVRPLLITTRYNNNNNNTNNVCNYCYDDRTVRK